MIESRGPFAVVVSDMRMPRVDGAQFLARVEEASPDSVRIMLTGNADQEAAVRAINEGHIFRFLNKPCRPQLLVGTIAMGIRQYRLQTAERELLEKTFSGGIRLLSDVLAIASPDAFGRGQ